MILDVHERPKWSTWLFLSFQHVFAMFNATVLVPLLTGYPISTALFASGLGTLIYAVVTKFKVPVYLGSSFAYIGAVNIAIAARSGSKDAAQTALFLVGVIYVVVALLVKVIGKDWIKKVLPPIVIGPMIIVIGLSLASSAVTNAGFVENSDFKHIIVACVTMIAIALIATKAKHFFKIIPFMCGVLIGYVVAIALGIVDFSPVEQVIASSQYFGLPQFILPFKFVGFESYQMYFGPETYALLPVALVTISEHIGDHSVLSKICNKDFLKDPGLDRTLIGDGVATSISALLGGPANTTYGENTGVIGMSKVASVYVTCGAAVIAIMLSFTNIVSAFIQTIPSSVLGGMGIILYGIIASNGLSVLIDNKVDFTKQRNLIIASTMLVVGIGGAVLPIGSLLLLSGTALSALVGIILNLILPKE